VINSILQIPVWQYVVSMAILFACGSIVTYMIIRKPRVHSEHPVKRLVAEVSPELHAEVKSFCEILGITMKKLIIDSVQKYMVQLEATYLRKSIEKDNNRLIELEALKGVSHVPIQE
jgi:hypothetical protein